MTTRNAFVYQDGNSVYIDKNGTRFLLKDVAFGEMTCTGCDDMMVQEYQVTGPRGMDTIAWLMRNFPSIQYRDPQREKIDALAAYHEAIGRQAVEKYKREHNIQEE